MSNSPINRSTTHARDLAIIAGIKKRLQGSPPIVLGGVSYTADGLVALFQSQIDAGNATVSAKGQWSQAVQNERAVTKKINGALIGFQEIVRQMFDNAPDALADFGLAPRKVAKRDPLTNVVAAEKNRATREARHTLGKKAKLDIQGTVTAASVAAAVAATIGPEPVPPREPAETAETVEAAVPKAPPLVASNAPRAP
jgi:hypothetical protein